MLQPGDLLQSMMDASSKPNTTGDDHKAQNLRKQKQHYGFRTLWELQIK